MKLIPIDDRGVMDIVDTDKTFIAVVTLGVRPSTYYILQHDEYYKYHFRKIDKESGAISSNWISCAVKSSIQECVQKNTGSHTKIYAFDNLQEFLDSPL